MGSPVDDAVLSRWLESTLRTERAKLAKSLYQNVNVQLEEHHKAVFEALSEKLNEVLLKPSPGNAENTPTSALSGAEISVISEGKVSVPDELESAAPPAQTQSSLISQKSQQLNTTKTKKHYKSKALCDLAGQHYKDQSDSERSCFQRFVRGNKFDLLSTVAILGCAVSMIFEIQYAGFDSGHDLGVKFFDRPSNQVWPGARRVFADLNIAWNVVFLAEFVIRLAVMREEVIFCGWTWFDAVLISLGYLDMFGLLNIGLNPTMLRMLRLARVMRLLKMLKAVKQFQTLFLLVRSVQASSGALLWSFLLLCAAQMISSIFMCQMLRELIDDKDAEEPLRETLFNYFGTFENAMVTMFEITLSNWVPACRLMVEHVSVWYGMLILVYRGCFMFALIKVITAVFLAETTRCANSDDNIAVQKRKDQKAMYEQKLTEIFSELDESGDGFLTLEEFMPLITDELLTTWLTTLEIDTHDLVHLFGILDTGDNKIDIQEFTKGMSRVRGPAKSIDVLKLHTITRDMTSVLEGIVACVGAPLPDHVNAQEEVASRQADNETRGVLELTELVLALATDMDARQRQQDAKLNAFLGSVEPLQVDPVAPSKVCPASNGSGSAANWSTALPARGQELWPKNPAISGDLGEISRSREQEQGTKMSTEASLSRERRAEAFLDDSPSPLQEVTDTDFATHRLAL